MAEGILICDDDPMLGETLRQLLSEQGYQVRLAETGEAALQAITTEPPALLLLDRMLPDADGLDICRKLRATYTGPIMMMSVRDAEIDRVLGLEIGADAYLPKPFGLAELVARVEAQLRRAGPLSSPVGPPTPLQIGALTLDVEGRQVWRDGRDLPLTPKEFDLLAVLASHKGAVVRSSRLLQQVWGYDASIRTRTLDVHVGRLRAKIETEPRKPRLLLTVPGVGYRLCMAEDMTVAA